MFQPKFILESIHKNLDRFFLKDVTGKVGDITYQKKSDGTYQQITNDWGFGSPNPLRSTMAVIFASVHKQKGKDVWDEAHAYNPLDEAVGKVAFSYTKDGHREFYMFVIPVFAEEAAYVVGDYAFFPDGNKKPYMGEVRKMTGEGNWEPKSVDALAAEYKLVTHKSLKEDVLYGKAYEEFGELDFDRKEAIIGGEKCKNDKYELRREWEAYTLLRAIKAARCNNYYTSGEKLCRTIEAFLEA